MYIVRGGTLLAQQRVFTNTILFQMDSHYVVTCNMVYYIYMKQGNPHYARRVFVIGLFFLALVVFSAHHMTMQHDAQEAVVLRAYESAHR